MAEAVRGKHGSERGHRMSDLRGLVGQEHQSVRIRERRPVGVYEPYLWATVKTWAFMSSEKGSDWKVVRRGIK